MVGSSILAFATASALASEVRCQDGAVRGSLTEAVADPSCAEIALGEGTLHGPVDIRRSVAIRGRGPGASVLSCDRGPCVVVADGAEVALAGVTVRSPGAAIHVEDATLRLSDAELVPDGASGGWLRLTDSDATITDVRVAMSAGHRLPIEAVSSFGHDLTLDRVTFVGLEPAASTRSFVYTVAYGVVCHDCRFEVSGGPDEAEAR